MKIFVVGSGKLANALLQSEMKIDDCEIVKWDSKHAKLRERTLCIHAGSGRQLKEVISFCSKTKSVLLELSTGMESENRNVDFPLIICPNTSILLLKTMNVLKANGSFFSNYSISITESHQSTKKTEPGTAYFFAKSLDFPVNKIISIRDPKIQEHEIGIPKEYLDRHAYHKIVISDGPDEVTIETKVLGHNSYAHGVQSIIEAVLKNELEHKKHSVMDLIDENIL